MDTPISSRPVRLLPNEILNAGEFTRLAAGLMHCKGDALAAAPFLEAQRSPDRIVRIAKSAVGAASLSVPGWAGVLDAGGLVGGFLESLQSVSAFDAMLPSMRRIPLKTRAVSITVAGSGAIGSEGAPMAVSRLQIAGGDQLEPRRAYSLIVMSAELARAAVDGASGFFSSELRRGVAAATDAQFLAGLIAATTPSVSSGTDLAAVRADLAVLLHAVTPRDNSRLFVVMRPETATDLSVARSADGTLAFPNLSYRGGELSKDLPALVSDQLPAGTVLMVDATGLAGDSGEVLLDGSSHTALQLESAPTNNSVTPVATTVVDLFSTNGRALKAERWFGYEVVRAGAVAALTEVDWLSATGSDA